MDNDLLDFQMFYTRSAKNRANCLLWGTGRWGSDILSIYGILVLSLMGLITLARMGFSGICYIGLAYQNRYCEPIKTVLLRIHSRDFTTLGLCSASANVMYKQCLDHKVSHVRRSGVL